MLEVVLDELSLVSEPIKFLKQQLFVGSKTIDNFFEVKIVCA